jgi:hypothetical protein
MCVVNSRNVAEVLRCHRVRCQLNGKPTKMYPTAADFERFKSHASAYTGLVAFVYVAFFFKSKRTGRFGAGRER